MELRIARILFLIGIFLSLHSQAARFAGVVGARTNAANSIAPSDVAEGKPSWQAGVLAYIPIFWDLKIRTGFLYETKSYSLQNSGDARYDFGYIEVPASLVYAINQKVFAFGGAGFLMNVEKTCNRPTGGVCSTGGTSGNTVAYHFGFGSQIWEQFGLEIYYEVAPGNIQQNNGAGFKDGSSIVGQLMYMF